ncbi:uncharacterized protein LOC141631896 [Silene latifolia]|uniref:uncharacterized protein LOC141631896 n=1 Tax=Silene latifolia TaxID=37657 RepID=UPI003D76DDB3
MEYARTVSAAYGGNIVNKSPPEAWTIIGELAESSRDFARKYAKRGVNLAGSSSSSSHLEEKVDTLTSLFKDMMSGQRMAMVCAICSDGHPSEHCPLMQEGSQEEVNGVWERTPQKKWDPYSNTFNPGWKAHPNFQWAGANGDHYSNALPPQTVVIPKNVSAVSLRNGRQLVEDEKVKRKDKEPVIHEIVEEIVIKKGEEASIVKEKEQIPSSIPMVEPEVPFPDALKRTHHFEHDKDIYKELCTIKRNNKLKGVKKVKVSEHVSAIFQRKLPPKCSDPGMFTIPCTIGNTKIQKAMLNLGASINVMPYSLYKSMKLGPLHDTSVVIQLANRSNVYPKGMVEDVPTLVDNLIFPADFYVLDMEHDKHAAPILLGRSFLKTASTKIDVSSGSMTMESNGQIVRFNIYDAMKYPADYHSMNFVNVVVDPVAQDFFNLNGDDELQVALENSVDVQELEYAFYTNLQEVVTELRKLEELPLNFNNKLPLTIPSEKLLPSVLQAPVVELKALPEHLKYIFLGERETLPIIISSKLTEEQ